VAAEKPKVVRMDVSFDEEDPLAIPEAIQDSGDEKEDESDNLGRSDTVLTKVTSSIAESGSEILP